MSEDMFWMMLWITAAGLYISAIDAVFFSDRNE